MNLEKWIKEQSDSCLWNMLCDFGTVMSGRKYEGKDSSIMNCDTFWILLSKMVTDELDRRLIADYNDGLDDLDDEDD